MTAATCDLSEVGAADVSEGTRSDDYDHEREQRISYLGQHIVRAMRNGDKPEASRAWDELKAAVLGRSPERVAKMEQQLNERIACSTGGP